jgi:amidase
MPFHDPARVELGKLRVAFYTDNGFAAADDEVASVVRAAARALAGEVAAVEEDRPACLEQAYDLEMKLIGADGGDGLREYLKELGSTRAHTLLTGWLDKLNGIAPALRLCCILGGVGCVPAEMSAFAGTTIVCPVYTYAALPHGASTQEENFTASATRWRTTWLDGRLRWLRDGGHRSADWADCGTSVEEDIALAVAARLE